MAKKHCQKQRKSDKKNKNKQCSTNIDNVKEMNQLYLGYTTLTHLNCLEMFYIGISSGHRKSSEQCICVSLVNSASVYHSLKQWFIASKNGPICSGFCQQGGNFVKSYVIVRTEMIHWLTIKIKTKKWLFQFQRRSGFDPVMTLSAILSSSCSSSKSQCSVHSSKCVFFWKWKRSFFIWITVI